MYYGRMLDAEFERQATLDFMDAALGYSRRDDAPELTIEVTNLAKALDSRDVEAQQAFHEGMGLFCEGYWAIHGSPKGIEWKSPDRFSDDASLARLEADIGATLDELILERGLPVEVTHGPEFQEATAADVEGTGMPAGTALVIGFDDPSSLTGVAGSAREVPTYSPLELYADAVRPYFHQMDFVVAYMLPLRNVTQDVFLIHSDQMRLYLNGDITTNQLANKMLVFGL